MARLLRLTTMRSLIEGREAGRVCCLSMAPCWGRFGSCGLGGFCIRTVCRHDLRSAGSVRWLWRSICCRASTSSVRSEGFHRAMRLWRARASEARPQGEGSASSAGVVLRLEVCLWARWRGARNPASAGDHGRMDEIAAFNTLMEAAQNLAGLGCWLWMLSRWLK